MWLFDIPGLDDIFCNIVFFFVALLTICFPPNQKTDPHEIGAFRPPEKDA